jgi:hypothetical protein
MLRLGTPHLDALDQWKHTLADTAAMKLMFAAAEIQGQERIKQVS